MNILIITPRIPYPPFRGDKLKIYNLAKNLSKNNSVRILTFLRNNNQLNDLKNIEASGIKIEIVKLSFAESIFHAAAALFTNLPFQAAWFQSAKMKKKFKEILSQENFDFVYYHLIRSAQYLNSTNEKCRPINIIDFTDAVSLYLKRFAGIEKNPFKKFFVKIEQKRIEQYEKIAQRFHSLFICSEVDKEFLKQKGLTTDIRILRNGIDTDYFKPEKIGYEKNRIIFTGNMPYYANYDAAIHFSKNIFPIILKNIPEAEFYIVGQNPPKRIKLLAASNVFVTGFVPDIKTEYLRSAVNVAPMRFGAGTLNKVLESIALGVPVVATSVAIGGLPKNLYKYLFVADDPEEFANRVVEIIKNPKIREELMIEGAEVIRKMLSWEKIVGEFENYLVDELSKIS